MAFFYYEKLLIIYTNIEEVKQMKTGNSYNTAIPVDEFIHILEKQRSIKVIAERNQYFMYRHSEPGNVITTGSDITKSVPIVEQPNSMILVRCNDRGEPYLKKDGYPQTKQVSNDEFNKEYNVGDNGIAYTRDIQMHQLFIIANRKARLSYRDDVYFVEMGDYIDMNILKEPNAEVHIVTKEYFEENYTIIEQENYKVTPSFMEDQGYEIASQRQQAEAEQLENDEVLLTKGEAIITNQEVDTEDIDGR